MTVTASLTDFDSQTVLSLRTCRCACNSALIQVIACETLVPLHLLSLGVLAGMNLGPAHCPCPFCGDDTTAEYRAAIVVPAEQELPALAHIRCGEGEPLYALLARSDSGVPDGLGVLPSLNDPDSWQLVEPDEEVLIERWGRPLSTLALVRSRLAAALDSEKQLDVLRTTGGVSYLFFDVGESDQAAAEAFAAVLEAAAELDLESMIPLGVLSGTGYAGSIVECLGPHRARLDRLGILGIAAGGVLEHEVTEALSVYGFTCVRAEGVDAERVLYVEQDGVVAELAMRAVAARSLLFGLTLAEAALLETQRLSLRLEAFRSAAVTVAEALGERGSVEPGAEGWLRLIGPDDCKLGDLNLASLLPKESWDLGPEVARGIVDRLLASGEGHACVCGRSTVLAHLRSSGFASERSRTTMTPIWDDSGAEFELVACRDCEHAIHWTFLAEAPSETELAQGLDRARFEAEAITVGIGENAIAILLRGNALATMLAHPGLSRRLARNLAPKLHANTLLAWAATTDTIVIAADNEALELGRAALINAHPHDLPGQPLCFFKQISTSGPASGSLKLHWLSATETEMPIGAGV